MKIIQAHHGHIPNIARVISACMETMRKNGICQWDEIYPNKEIITNDVNSRSLYVLELKNICMAAVTLDGEQEPAYLDVPWMGGEPALVVHRLCVDPAFQGKGIGSRMMDFAEEYARQNAYVSIRLDAYSGNPKAVCLYERRGYRKTGQVYFPRRTMPFSCYEKML
jgi:ribosomal protein S18 acetylase RimI-like enzyme